jgi:hypothetical protein
MFVEKGSPSQKWSAIDIMQTLSENVPYWLEDEKSAE